MVSFIYSSGLAFRKMLGLITFCLFISVNLRGQQTVTVIVHGFQLEGSKEDLTDFYTFARAIKARAGANTGIYTNDWTTTGNGGWYKLSNSTSPNPVGRPTDCEITDPTTANIILIYNWATLSNDLGQGSLESAADHLFAALAQPSGLVYSNDDTHINVNFITNSAIKKHFIGHSRGNVVLMQVLRRINKYFPITNASPTSTINHWTVLDAHPAETYIDDVSLWGVAKDISFTDYTTYKLQLPAADMGTPIVAKVDNYFRRAIDKYQPLPSANFSGVSVQGASEVELNETNLGTGCYGTRQHSNVHAWYFGTISGATSALITYGLCQNQSLPATWYSGGLRLSSGYNRSFLGGEYNSLPNATGTSVSILDAAKPNHKLQNVFNGNFNYGSYGWTYNGGAHEETAFNQFVSGISGKAQLPAVSSTSAKNYIKHSTMYFPKNAKWLQFSAGTVEPFTTSKVKVSFFDKNGELIKESVSREVEISNSSFKKFYTDIPKALKEKAGSFRIMNIGSTSISIDDVLLTDKANGTIFQIAPPNGGGATESINNYEDAVYMYRDYAENNFTNLSNNAWYKSYAQDGAGYGLFEGDAYNSFNAYESVTRGEAVAIIVNSALKLNILRGGNLNISTTNGLFSDVPEDYQYFPYIQALRNLGYLNINATNTFNPNDNLTLGQFCKLLSLTYWDNITPPATTLPNVNRTASQFNVIIPPNTNPDFAPHISKILNTFTAKTKGSKKWAERIFNFKLNASSSGYDNVIDANVVLDRASMIKAMTNVFEFRRNELANAVDVSNFITLGEKWELPTNTSGSNANFSTINDVDLRMIAGTQLSLNASIPNLDNPHFYWSINGGTLTPNNAAANFNIVNFTAPLVTVSTTLTLYVYAGSTSGRAVEVIKNIIVDPVGTVPTRDSVNVKFRVTLKGTGRKVHPTGMRITGALGAFTQPDWTPLTAAVMVLESPTRDSIYSTTIKIPRRVAPNDVYEFKYVNGDEWGDGSNDTPEDERGLTEECAVSLYFNRFFTLTPLPATSMILPCYRFNTCTVYNQSVLPIELIDFTANYAKGNAILNWQTANEKDNDHFDIERSTNGKQFTKISDVKAFGSTNQVQNYKYLDASLPPQYNLFYYRLRQVDKDNKAEYSPIRSIRIDKQDKASIKIHPNPNNGQFVATVSRSDKDTEVSIQNSRGQVIWKGIITAGQENRDIQLEQATNGLYFVSYRNSQGFINNAKFVINR